MLFSLFDPNEKSPLGVNIRVSFHIDASLAKNFNFSRINVKFARNALD